MTAALAAILFWPEASVDPNIGTSPSYEAGYALASAHGLAWGPEIVFTFGPLGFLQNTAYYSATQSLLGSIYQPLVIVALFLGIAAALRQRRTPITSLTGAFVATGIVTILHIGHGPVPGLEYPELAFLAAFAWASVPLLQQSPKRSTVFVTCLGLGAVAGLQLLVKFNTGITIAAISLVLSALLGWREIGRHAATVCTFVASVLIWWILAGQHLGDLRIWLKYSADIVSGYGEAIVTPHSPFAGPTIALVLAWVVALCVMYARGRPQIPRRFLIFVGVALAIAARTALRLDLWSWFGFLGFTIVAITITPYRRPGRRLIAMAMVVALVALSLVGEQAINHTIGSRYDRIAAAVQAPAQAVERLVAVAQPRALERRIQEAKTRQRALYAVPDSFIKAIGTAPVHIDPSEASVAWAYDLNWRPIPVFQTYQAYTPTLDALDAATLTSRTDFVLSRVSATFPAVGVYGLLGVQTSSRYSRALLCNYTVEGVENGWALFKRVSPRCGPLAELSHVDIRGDGPVSIPSPSKPDSAVLVGIDLRPTLVDRLFQGVVFPMAISTVTVDGVSYRLLTANAAEPFLVVSPASVEGTNLQINAKTISIGRAPSLGQGEINAQLRFYEMRLDQSS